MIILFGSYARGNWVENLVTGYFSDYDLMVIVATEEQARDRRQRVLAGPKQPMRGWGQGVREASRPLIKLRCG